MRKRKIAALSVIIVLVWPLLSGELPKLPSISASSSLIGVQLAQEGGEAGGYSTQGPVGGSAGGPVTIEGRNGEPEEGGAACAGKSAGDSCSFTDPDGQTVSGACSTIPNQLLCAPVGGMFHYKTGEAGSQPEGAR